MLKTRISNIEPGATVEDRVGHPRSEAALAHQVDLKDAGATSTTS
jgi:hypothetical protein